MAQITVVTWDVLPDSHRDADRYEVCVFDHEQIGGVAYARIETTFENAMAVFLLKHDKEYTVEVRSFVKIGGKNVYSKPAVYHLKTPPKSLTPPTNVQVRYMI